MNFLWRKLKMIPHIVLPVREYPNVIFFHFLCSFICILKQLSSHNVQNMVHTIILYYLLLCAVNMMQGFTPWWLRPRRISLHIYSVHVESCSVLAQYNFVSFDKYGEISIWTESKRSETPRALSQLRVTLHMDWVTTEWDSTSTM